MYEQRRLCRNLPLMRERAIRSNTIHFKLIAREWLSWGNWWLSRGKFLTLQLNPAMRGASKEQHRVLGGSFTYGKAFTYALFLGYSKPEKFWICNQGWSNCRCPLGTFMCFLLRHCCRFKEDYAYSYYAGWFYHCSFSCKSCGRPRIAEWAWCGSRFSFYTT